VRRGRIDETKAAADEHTEVNAVAKGGDDRGLGEGFGGVGDPKIGAKDRDEALDDDPLGPKTMKQLVARQPRRGATVTKTGGGGAEPERKENPTENGAETRTKRKLGFFFFICAPRERKETWTMPSATTGAASPWFTGAGSKTC